MPMLPRSGSSLLISTDFTDDDAWDRLISEALREYEGWIAYVVPVSDTAFDGAPWSKVRAAVPANDNGAAVLFIADSRALTSPDHPILVVDLGPTEEPSFRCIPSELWSVENNLNLANMDWREFVAAVDDDGVFRGFGGEPRLHRFMPCLRRVDRSLTHGAMRCLITRHPTREDPRIRILRPPASDEQAPCG